MLSTIHLVNIMVNLFWYYTFKSIQVSHCEILSIFLLNDHLRSFHKSQVYDIVLLKLNEGKKSGPTRWLIYRFYELCRRGNLSTFSKKNFTWN